MKTMTRIDAGITSCEEVHLRFLPSPRFCNMSNTSIATLSRGAQETSSQIITNRLFDHTKTSISSRFRVSKDSISIDWDAISVVVSTEQEMTDNIKEALRNFLLSFGDNALRCGFPQQATGSTKKDSVFGCRGNMCQHLPHLLQGKEMLVVDAPVKIALHVSCKEKLVRYLQGKGFYFSAATVLTGVCFDSAAAANKVPYPVLVDAIIETCQVKSTYIIHVADMGYRLPIVSHVPNKTINNLFDRNKKMREVGIKVEIVQFDIAFIIKVQSDHMIQVTCHTNKDHDTDSVLQGSSVKVFPLHKLPKFANKSLSAGDLKGTVQVTKNNWNSEKVINIGTVHPEELGTGINSEVTDLFTTSNKEEENARKSISTHLSSVYSFKGYSTIAHPLMQRRKRYPLSAPAMYGVGRRSIDVIQTLLRNLSVGMHEAFETVQKDGIGCRLEVSIRPHFNDMIRHQGHFNDILLLSCVAVREFCGNTFNPRINIFPARPVQTEAMKLWSEAYSMVKFRRRDAFDKVYANPKASTWLRFHLSLLLITVGISAGYGVRYINEWLRDPSRFDPHNLAGVSPPNENNNIFAHRMIQSLKRHLSRLGFSGKAVKHLIEFAAHNKCADPRDCYKSLSLRNKHLLVMLLWTDIIPHMSKFMSQEESRGKDMDRVRDGDDRDRGEAHFHEWWSEDGAIPDKILDEEISKAPMPKHPLALAIFSFVNMSRLWNPHLPGFDQILCHYVLSCHRQPQLGHGKIPEKKTLRLLVNCAVGKDVLSRNNLKHICSNLNVMNSVANRSTLEYKKNICQKYKFPWENVEYVGRGRKDASTRNECINRVLHEDIVIPVSHTASSTTFHRISDNTRIDIIRADKMFLTAIPAFRTKFSDLNIYKILARSLNTPSRTCIRDFLHSRLVHIHNLQNIFLTDRGFINEQFKGANTLHELELKHKFLLLFSGNIRDIVKSCHYVPEIIVAIASYVYEQNFTFYNMNNNKTYYFLYHRSRSIKYELRANNASNVTTSIPSLTIVLRKNKYEWNDIQNHVTPPMSIGQPNDLFSASPFGGGTHASKNLSIVPNRRHKRHQHFYTALSVLLKELDQHYLENHGNEESIGILQFLEELASNTMGFGDLDGSVIEQCPELGLPLNTLVTYLNNTVTSLWSHTLVCPLTCLKYNNLTLGVFERGENTKKTYFYAFNPLSRKVECKTVVDYCRLVNRRQVLYLYSTKNKSEHFAPNATEVHKTENKLHHHDSITGEYFHLGTSSLTRFLDIFHRSCSDMTVVMEVEEMTDHGFRPEVPDTVIIPTHIICQSCNETQYLLQRGISQHALIMIFPSNGPGQDWDACIVHHPLQDEISAFQVLKDFIRHAPTSGTYHCHCVEGRNIEGCESGFYLLLYAYLGAKCSTLHHFNESMENVRREENLRMKVSMWIKSVAVNKKVTNPAWMEQMLCYSSAHHHLISTQTPQTEQPTNKMMTPRERTPTNRRKAPKRKQNEGNRRAPTLQQNNQTKAPKRNRDDGVRQGSNHTSCDHSRLELHSYYEDCIERSVYAQCTRLPAPGLANPNNLCYVNVVVQLLYGMRCTREFFSNGPLGFQSYATYIDFINTGGVVAIALRRMFRKMMDCKSGDSSSVEDFKQSICTNDSASFQDFDNMRQHDAHQFLLRILHTLSSTFRTPEGGEDHISKWFRSPVISWVRCHHCGALSLNGNDNSMCLEVPVTGDTIVQCLKDYCHDQASVEWKCQCCKYQRASKGLCITRRPILIITLKRYDHVLSKISSMVKFPLDDFTIPQMDVSQDRGTSPSYKLVAVINHHGTTTSAGHYTLIMRSGRSWYHFNDAEVVQVEETEVVSQFAYTLVFCARERYNDLISSDGTKNAEGTKDAIAPYTTESISL